MIIMKLTMILWFSVQALQIDGGRTPYLMQVQNVGLDKIEYKF